MEFWAKSVISQKNQLKKAEYAHIVISLLSVDIIVFVWKNGIWCLKLAQSAVGAAPSCDVEAKLPYLPADAAEHR